MRTCSKCGQRRIARQFYDESSRPCRPCTRKAVLDWRAKNPEKVRAHKIVAGAMKKGILVRPSGCSKCFIACVPVAHHPNYSRPKLVIWVCDSCHGKIHAAKRNGKKGGRPKSNNRKDQARCWCFATPTDDRAKIPELEPQKFSDADDE